MATAATNATGVDESRNDGVRALAMYEVEQTEADEVGGRAGWSEEADVGARRTDGRHSNRHDTIGLSHHPFRRWGYDWP